MLELAHILSGISLFFSMLFGIHIPVAQQNNPVASSSTGVWDSVSLPTIKGEFFWENNGVVYDHKEPLVPSADVATFQTYRYAEGYSGPPLAKDKNTVWVAEDHWTRLVDADPGTIEPLSPPYSTTSEYTGNTRVTYIRDASHVWYAAGGDPESIPGADGATFVVLGAYPNDYAKDSAQVYYFGKVIPGADPATFRFIYTGGEFAYAKDAVHIYDNGKVLQEADARTFTPLAYPAGYEGVEVATDKSHVWLGSEMLAGADPVTFKPVYPPNVPQNIVNGYIWVNYYEDAAHVWYELIPAEVVAGADPSTFVALSPENGPFARDKNRAYDAGAAIPGSDATFTLLNDTYEKDATQVYANGRVIPGADPATFVPDSAAAVASDKNHRYYNGARIDYHVGDVVNGFTVTSVDFAGYDPNYLDYLTFAGSAVVRGRYSNDTQSMCGGPYFSADEADQGKLPDGITSFSLRDSDTLEQTLAPYDGKEVTIEITNLDESRAAKDCAGPLASLVRVVE